MANLHGSIDPVAWQNPLHPDQLSSKPIPNWTPLYTAAPVAQQYEAGDMASAAAQGFRDGVASVTQQPTKMPIPPGGADPLDVVYAEGWNAACDAYFGGKPAPEPVVITIEREVAQQPQATCKTCGRRMDDQAVIHGPNGCCPAQPPQALTRDRVRDIFMAHGFTIKDGQTDLKDYVYEAAAALLNAAQQPQAEPFQPDWVNYRQGLHDGWAEGYEQGIADERTSEASIGIAGFGAKVNPARENPYKTQPQPQAEAVPVVDRVYEAAKRLVDHADFQLGGVLSAKSKARDIPSNAASKVKARHLASLRDALAKAPHQAEAVQYTRADLDRAYSAGLVEGERLAIQQSEAVPPSNLIDPGSVVSFAVDRWLAEVANRPLVNKNRRTLDDTWRQVIRRFGGDPDVLLGPPHDDLAATAQQKGQS